jgi:hypothetical protein
MQQPAQVAKSFAVESAVKLHEPSVRLACKLCEARKKCFEKLESF